jgi:hypothetical protein
MLQMLGLTMACMTMISDAFLVAPSPTTIAAATHMSTNTNSRGLSPQSAILRTDTAQYVRSPKSSLDSKTPRSTAEFEYQELRVNLDSIKNAGAAPRDLSPLKQIELVDYCQKIALNRPSSVPLNKLASKLPGTKWRLAYSSDASMEALPRDATAYLLFTSGSQLDYVLQFGEKTFGLQKLTATSTWEMDEDGNLEYKYNKVTTDAFGFSNVGVGYFGLLQGRVSHVFTAYYDGQIWIELGVDAMGSNYASVYVREGDSW